MKCHFGYQIGKPLKIIMLRLCEGEEKQTSRWWAVRSPAVLGAVWLCVKTPKRSSPRLLGEGASRPGAGVLLLLLFFPR